MLRGLAGIHEDCVHARIVKEQRRGAELPARVCPCEQQGWD